MVVPESRRAQRADCTDGSQSACQCSEFGGWASEGGGMALVGGEGGQGGHLCRLPALASERLQLLIEQLGATGLGLASMKLASKLLRVQTQGGERLCGEVVGVHCIP